MKKTSLLLISFYSCLAPIFTQSITIQPYLQDANPNSVNILWETNTLEESIVEWGKTEALGNESIGTAYISEGDARIHEVHIENLERFTQYYYRVKTSTAVSDIYRFKTPPFASDEKPFRILAMSDMQNDASFPNKFQEIVEEGVIDYLENEMSGDLVDNLALVLISGDLVSSGNNFNSWKNEFFNPAEKLFSHVPIYPVLGNHEENTSYYFSYFKLPENGTAGFEEHWYTKDYANVRIIGLNSNSPYDGAEQLDWLDNILTSTCETDSIDFVFAQLHHPYKSELWTPGESNFTGDLINRLEQFTTDCGKPSIHFFGHTHGYSRGQSRDHKHLWINVATAGGAIDNWGEFPNFDYDEFSVSQDEYGFVIVEVTNDDDPKVIVKRISRGDQDSTINNLLSDSLTIRRNPAIVDTPSAISPTNNMEITPECVTLQASDFFTQNEEGAHGQSHWQVSNIELGFNNPIIEHWKNFENWYYDINTQMGDDLTDEKIFGLDEFQTYYWRVRYRDKEMNWSAWSTPASFKTGVSIALPNILLNKGAEDELNHWTIEEGVVEVLESGICDGIAPRSGTKYFAVGGLCEHSTIGRLSQIIDITAYADSVSSGDFPVIFGGYLSNFSGSDLPEMKLIFYNEDMLETGQSYVLSTLNSSWTLVSDSLSIPIDTRLIKVSLKGTRNSGTDNDSYFDDLFLTIGTPTNQDCDLVSTTNNFPLEAIRKLNIFPNPTKNIAHIKLPESLNGSFNLYLTNEAGIKVKSNYDTFQDSIRINIKDLPKGYYSVWIRENKGKTYAGKLIIME